MSCSRLSATYMISRLYYTGSSSKKGENDLVFICCGDALVDLFGQPAAFAGSVNLQGHVGGSPLNVAVGLARLGNDTAYLCKNSTDFIGQRITEYLKSNSVKTDWIVPSDLNSTLAMIQTNDDGSANYAFYTDNTADLSMQIDELPAQLSDALQVLHFGSYSTAVDPTSSSLLALATRESSQRLVSYDPNIRPTIEPDAAVWREKFAGFSKVADFVKASDEDIELLFGSGKTFDSFAADILAVGASLVAVTEGSKGATLYATNGDQVRSKPISVSVKDTVGAGDTYQAACLHWIHANGCVISGNLNMQGVALQELADFAATAAAITCTRNGADMPTLSDVQAALSVS